MFLWLAWACWQLACPAAARQRSNPFRLGLQSPRPSNASQLKLTGVFASNCRAHFDHACRGSARAAAAIDIDAEPLDPRPRTKTHPHARGHRLRRGSDTLSHPRSFSAYLSDNRCPNHTTHSPPRFQKSGSAGTSGKSTRSWLRRSRVRPEWSKPARTGALWVRTARRSCTRGSHQRQRFRIPRRS